MELLFPIWKWKHKKCSKPPTSIYIICDIIYIIYARINMSISGYDLQNQPEQTKNKHTAAAQQFSVPLLWRCRWSSRGRRCPCSTMDQSQDVCRESWTAGHVDAMGDSPGDGKRYIKSGVNLCPQIPPKNGTCTKTLGQKHDFCVGTSRV